MKPTTKRASGAAETEPPRRVNATTAGAAVAVGNSISAVCHNGALSGRGVGGHESTRRVGQLHLEVAERPLACQSAPSVSDALWAPVAALFEGLPRLPRGGQRR